MKDNKNLEYYSIEYNIDKNIRKIDKKIVKLYFCNEYLHKCNCKDCNYI